MISCLVLLLFLDAFVVVQLFAVNADAANHLVCLLYVVDVDLVVVAVAVLFLLPDDVLDELHVEEDVEEDVDA